MTRVEWPRNSGRVAEYNEFELAEIRALLDAGHYREVEFLHTMKFELDATIQPWTSSDGRHRVRALFPAPTPVTTDEGMST